MPASHRLTETLERIAVGGGNSAKRGWLFTLGRSLVASDGATASLDWRTRLWAARYGFLPRQYVVYDLAGNGRHDYVSDFASWMGTWYQAYSLVLNGEASNLVRDKLAFYFMSRKLGIPTPEVLGVIRQGRLHLLGERPRPAAWEELRSVADERGRLVVKPVTGAKGRDVIVLARSNDSYRVNGEETDWDTLERTLRELDYFLVSEWVDQAAYSSAIFPQTTNTIRLLTVRRSGRDAPIVAAAAHRFGRRCSLPTDNLSRGGLSVAIDRDTGALGRGASVPDSGRMIWHSHHPDTGAPMEGVCIPGWARLRNCIVTAANKLSFLPYLAWDAVSTGNDWTIIEVNHSPDLRVSQMHLPLLREPDVRAFFEEEEAFCLTDAAPPPHAPVPDVKSAKREWLVKVGRTLAPSRGPDADLDWRTKLSAMRRGFLPSSYLLFDLPAHERRDYVSDFERWTRTTRQRQSLALNGEGANLLRDKLAFYFMASRFAIPTPEVLGVIRRGRLHPVGEPAICTWADLREAVEKRGRVVVKPVTGAYGRGVIFLASGNGRFYVNGEARDWREVTEALCRLDYFMVTEWVEQAAYSSTIYPHTTNTIRILTVCPTDGTGPLLAAAIQRFGRERSRPLDCFQAGAFGVAIDPAAGTLGRAVSRPDGSKVEWHASHPDTAAPIEGVRVPRWDRIRDCVLEAATRLSFLPYVGWDVVSGEKGETILEGNHSPGLEALQIDRPLLSDPRVRAFLEDQGVVRRSIRSGPWPSR